MRTNMYYTANATSFGVDNVMGNGTYTSAYGSDNTNMHMPDLEVNSY